MAKKRVRFRAASAACIFALLIFASPRAQAEYPEVQNLDSRDALFVQLTADIARFHRSMASGAELPALLLLRYSPKPGEDLFGIAARTSVGTEAIATLNGLSGPDSLSDLTQIILPNLPGIYVPESPKSDFERILYASRIPQKEAYRTIPITLENGRSYVFFPDEKLSGIERAFFLDILFRFPLREGAISSEYGPRSDPFTGGESFHAGIDIAAPRGEPVLAARAGTVTAAGFDNELGNFVLIDHGAGYKTLYGHLATIGVDLSREVNSGTVIGTVGSTGLSTGPHLHFEVRAGESLRDPIPLIRGSRK